MKASMISPSFFTHVIETSRMISLYLFGSVITPDNYLLFPEFCVATELEGWQLEVIGKLVAERPNRVS